MPTENRTQSVDLRRARRTRGVEAVLDTALAFLREGISEPTADQLAERAGVSTSSLFRYFESIDDMRSQAAARLIERHGDLIRSSPTPDADLGARIDEFVEVRLRVGEHFGPMMTTLQARVNTDELSPLLAQFRTPLWEMPDRYFGPELATLTQARRAELAALVDTLTSIEAWRHLTTSHGRTPRQTKRAWASAVGILIEDYTRAG